MALVESNNFEIGTKAPDFKLFNTVSNKIETLSDLKGNKGTVVLFICNHCPYVIHINEQLVKIANEYISKGIHFIAISSNDADNYPQDGPDFMKQRAEELSYPFPYLYDENQSVAKEYNASCTPDIYLFDHELKAVYHGQFDNSRPGNQIAITGNDLKNAMDVVLNDEGLVNNQKPSIGCSIKWK